MILNEWKDYLNTIQRDQEWLNIVSKEFEKVYKLL